MIVTKAIYDVRESDNCEWTFETHFITHVHHKCTKYSYFRVLIRHIHYVHKICQGTFHLKPSSIWLSKCQQGDKRPCLSYIWSAIPSPSPGSVSDHSLMSIVLKLNLGCCFFVSKVVFSWMSVDRFGKHVLGLLPIGQVKSVPNFC